MERLLPALSRQWLLLFAGLAIAAAAWPALADPPTRAARISLVTGSASFSPAGSDEWVEARINRPIWIGDRLWAGDGRIELQLGGASLRMAPGTSLQVLNFDDRIAQFEVTQGAVALHVRVIDRNDSIEIDTPTFAFVAREVGDYRIDVERDYTAVAVRRGFADIYGQDVSYRVDRREQFAFYSADLRDFDAGPLPRPDAFDRWVRERAQREDRSPSARYVSPELVGYVDLDEHGEWRTDTTLGAVWIPRVSADWAPYRHGNWTWVDPWGWTWIDDAPWGYAPSHYGRWTRVGTNWGWVPGPRTVTPVYAPALVAWVGGENFSLSFSTGRTRAVGWFPLAPGEIWRPTYDVSREYFTRVNVTNTVVNNTTVVNVYNTRNDVRVTNVDYRFRSAPAAVTAVPVETFVQSRPVQRAAVQVNANAVAQANVLVTAPATPVVQSIVGQSPRAQARPPAESMQRQVVARTAPAAAVPTIENRAAMIREGKPIDREALQRAAPQAAPQAAQPGAQPAAPQQAGRAPAGSADPRQLRANVRVVDAEKAQPAPVPAAPTGGANAARRAEREDAKAAREAERDTGKAARPAERDEAKGPARPGQAPQAAQPSREVATPPKSEPPPKTEPQPGAQPSPAVKPQPQPAPPMAQPPREAAPPVRGEEAQPRGQQGRPVTREERNDQQPGRGEPAGGRGQSPATQQTPATQQGPVTQPAPAPRTAPAPRREIPPVNVDQLQRDQPPGKREQSERAGSPSDERRAQPVMPKNGQPAQPPTAPEERRAPPVTPAPRTPETAAPRPPSSPPPAAQAPRPQQPAPPQSAAPQAQRPQADAPRPAAPPAAQQPPAPPREQPAEARRDQPKGKGKARDEEEEKEKEKDRKGRGN